VRLGRKNTAERQRRRKTVDWLQQDKPYLESKGMSTSVDGDDLKMVTETSASGSLESRSVYPLKHFSFITVDEAK
jgi:hypothetical protein